jgi:threonine dehydratase
MSFSSDRVREASVRLAGVARVTPILTSRTLDERTGLSVHCKAESFQNTGSFKFRGAYNAVSQLDATQLLGGVVTNSSGNHAQAIARAARLCGTSCCIVMPHDAPASKRAAAEADGAEIIGYDRYTEDRAALAAAVALERGWTEIPPFDHHHVIAGQGTVALEMFAEVPDITTLVVPVGGGGLIAGCATVAASHGTVEVIGVEPEAGDDHVRSRAANQRVHIDVPHTIADGQQVEAPGELTWAINQDRVDEFVTVTDEQLVSAMRFALERMKIVLEPSGASALAAVLFGVVAPKPGSVVGVVLSGGNIDADRLRTLFDNYQNRTTA